MAVKIGSLLICVMLMLALPILPDIDLSSVEGFYAASWAFLGFLAAAAFLKDFFRQK